MPALGEEYARLMRGFKIQENMVELLTKQLEMARLSEAKDVSPLQVLQKARVPDKRIKPHRAYIIIMMTVTAFILSAVIALVTDRFGRIPENEQLPRN